MRIDIGEGLAGQRLDVVVSRATNLGRAATRRLFAAGKVKVVTAAGGGLAKKGELAELGSVVEVTLATARPQHAVPDAFELTFVLRSKALVIVDKPAGTPTAPIRPDERGTIANALVAEFPEMATLGYSLREPGLCHRLDTATSGLLMAARNGAAFDEITESISKGVVDKRYLLICHHAALAETGTISLALRPQGPRMRVAETGRNATTHYRVLERHGDLALVEARACPATRHQVRAHFAAVGAPLLGDASYGGEMTRLTSRHALHASRIAYPGGVAVPAFEVESPLPPDLAVVLAGGESAG